VEKLLDFERSLIKEAARELSQQQEELIIHTSNQNMPNPTDRHCETGQAAPTTTTISVETTPTPETLPALQRGEIAPPARSYDPGYYPSPWCFS
jgi:hypothetical protein